MDIQNTTNRNQDPVSHAEINIEKIFSDSSICSQGKLQVELFELFNSLTNTCEKLGISRGKAGLASVSDL